MNNITTIHPDQTESFIYRNIIGLTYFNGIAYQMYVFFTLQIIRTIIINLIPIRAYLNRHKVPYPNVIGRYQT